MLKYDWRHHLNKAEIKALKKEDLPEEFVSPNHFVNKEGSERVFVDKDEIKQEMEENKMSRDDI